MGHAVLLSLIINVIVASSYPYSHLPRMRGRRIPNPRQIYSDQSMLLRGVRDRKAAPQRSGEADVPFPDPRSETPTHGRNYIPQRPQAHAQNSASTHFASRPESDQPVTYLGNQPLIQKSLGSSSHLPLNQIQREDAIPSNDGSQHTVVPSGTSADERESLLNTPEVAGESDQEKLVHPQLKQTLGIVSTGIQDNTELNHRTSLQQPSDQQIPFQQPSDQQIPFQQPSDQQLPFQQPSDQQLPFQQPSDQQIPFQQPSNQQIPFQQLSNQQIPFQQPSDQQLPFQQPSDQQIPFQHPSNQHISYQQPSDQQIPFQQPSDQQMPYQQPSDQQMPYQQPSDQQVPLQQASDLKNSYQPEPHQQLPFQQGLNQQIPFQQASNNRQLPFQHLPDQKRPSQQPSGHQTQFQQPRDQESRFQQTSNQQRRFQQPANQQIPFQRNGRLSNPQMSYPNHPSMLQPNYEQPSPFFNGGRPGTFQQPMYYNNGPMVPLNQRPYFHGLQPRSEERPPFRGNEPDRTRFNDEGQPRNHAPFPSNGQDSRVPVDPSKPDLSSEEHSEQEEAEDGSKQIAENDQEAPDGLPRGEESCDDVICPELRDCVNATREGCCATCERLGCQCQGYQYYDCVSNGFENGLVPEGESYSVDMGSTICSCPTGGGDILCSFQDPFGGEGDDSPPQRAQLLCPPPPRNCIESFTQPDGCAGCIAVGCVGRDGGKHRAGSRVSESACSTCSCPVEGGEIFCRVDAACEESNSKNKETIDEPQQTSLALEATQRVMRDPLAAERGGLLYDKDNIEEGYDTRFLQEDWNTFPVDKSAEGEARGGFIAPQLSNPGLQDGDGPEPAQPGPFYRGDYGPYNNLQAANQRAPFPYNYQDGYGEQNYRPLLPNRPEDASSNREADPEDSREDGAAASVTSNNEEGHRGDGEAPHLPFPNYISEGQQYRGFPDGSLPANYPPLAGGRMQQYLGYLPNSEADSPGAEAADDDPGPEGAQQYPNFGQYPFPRLNGQPQENIGNGANLYNGQFHPYPLQYPEVNQGFPRQPGTGFQVPYNGVPYVEEDVRRLQSNFTNAFPGLLYPLQPTAMTQQLLYELNNHSIENNQSTSFENVLSACCHQGQQWGVAHGSCVGIPVNFNTYSQICAVAQEKCCRQSREQESCKSGITTARSMAACDVTNRVGSCESGFKTCCDCCALGLKAYSLSIDCNMEILGEPCNSAYMRCCREGRMVPDASMTSSPSAGPVPTSETPSVPEGTIPRCATHNNCPHTCVDIEEGIECACLSGFALEEDGRTCTDINECVLGTHDCVDGQFCLNLLGSFNCQRLISCGTGYELTDKNTCNDIDECSLNLHNCGARLTCVNIRGSFRCVPKLCAEGFFTDATGGCIDIDECRAGDFSCPARTRCHNTVGSYSCLCPEGLAFDKPGNICLDVDECAQGTARCAAGATCLNTDGSYTCLDPPKLRCGPGFEPNQDSSSCVDVDECTRGTHTCAEGSTCINDPGSFRCEDPIQCQSGTRPSDDRRRCVDIDECQADLCGDGGVCVNAQGSYQCECAVGFRKIDNVEAANAQCEDINECSIPGEAQCMHECENNAGSFTCVCPTGYTLSKFGRTCDDIDECALNRDACTSSQTCFNTRGSYRCVELDCPEHYAKLSNRRCVRQPCRKAKDKRGCIRLPKQVSFHNISVTSNAPKEKALFRMSLSRGFPTDRYYFLLTAGNENRTFHVSKKRLKKRQTGVVYTRRRLTGPRDYVLDLTLKLYRKRRWATFISRLYIFVSEFTF